MKTRCVISVGLFIGYNDIASWMLAINHPGKWWVEFKATPNFPSLGRHCLAVTDDFGNLVEVPR